jgi:hypothetical protein
VHRERSGLIGYAALVALVLSGIATSFVLGGMGVSLYFGAGESEVTTAAQGHELLGTLELSVLLFSFGVLGLLVAIVAFIVLVKSLSDDVARERRGPISHS